MTTTERGVLHRHEDGREHRHFDAGFTIGGQVIKDKDGTEDHQHSTWNMLDQSKANESGPVAWTEEEANRA